MTRKRRQKPRPSLSTTLYVADKKRAAIGQLESAILLWFNEGDPISILVLATNAHDCYHALGKKIGKPSWHQDFAEKMPPSFQERAKYIPDFSKHGFMDLDETAEFDTTFSEGLMLISVGCHSEIFGRKTPLMALYWARMFSERPSWTGEAAERFPKVVSDDRIIEDVALGSRKQCFDSFYAFFREAYLLL
jgi:hypothetical protein